jgi:hypothetical protein
VEEQLTQRFAKMKRHGYKSFSLLFSVLLIGPVETKCQTNVLQGFSIEKECVRNMLMIWEKGAWVIQHSPPQDSLRLPQNEREGKRGIEYTVVNIQTLGNIPKNCPTGGAYDDFILMDGPVCPSGHEIAPGIRDGVRLQITGPTNRFHIYTAITNKSACVREAAVQWLDRSVQAGMLAQDEARRIARGMLRDDDSRVRCTAIRQMTGLGYLHNEDRAALEMLRQDKSELVRSEVILAIGDHPTDSSPVSRKQDPTGSNPETRK